MAWQLSRAAVPGFFDAADFVPDAMGEDEKVAAATNASILDAVARTERQNEESMYSLGAGPSSAA